MNALSTSYFLSILAIVFSEYIRSYDHRLSPFLDAATEGNITILIAALSAFDVISKPDGYSERELQKQIRAKKKLKRSKFPLEKAENGGELRCTDFQSLMANLLAEIGECVKLIDAKKFYSKQWDLSVQTEKIGLRMPSVLQLGNWFKR